MPVHHADRKSDPVLAYVTGDPHLPEDPGRGPWADAPDASGDALFALAYAADLCVRDRCDLILPGDIFDGPDPAPEALADVYNVLRRVTDAGGRVLYILGNHDRSRDWLVPLGKGATRLDGTVVDAPIGSVTGLSYQHPDSFAAAVAGVGEADVGVYHQTWVELVRHGRTRLADLPNHRLAVGGDVHITKTFGFGPEGPDVALSPGVLAPQSVTDFGHTYVHAVTRPEGLCVTPVRLPGRVFLSMRVTTREAMDRALVVVSAAHPDPDLPYDVSRPFVSVRLDGPMAETVNREALERAAERSGAVLRVEYGRPQRVAVPSSKIYPSDSLTGAVAAAPITEAARAACLAVLCARDPAAVLNDIRAAAESGAHHAPQVPASN